MGGSLRNTKVEETVYETLTKQYELAKVEEARETPSVKVLDPADVPESKSFPPRTLIVLFCMVLVVSLASAWILGRARWEAVDPGDPGKILAQEVFQTIRARVKEFTNRSRRRLGVHGNEPNSQ